MAEVDAGELEARAAGAVQAARKGVQWIAKNERLLGEESAQLGREFRRYAISAQKLADAVRRPMCVGVFGPSQAGKSFLISALARKDGTRLMADFAGRHVDFVAEINPEGGQESTGIVTRFTIRKTPPPAGFPVQLRLLSQVDLVKILANAYFLDLDHSKREPLEPAQIRERIDEVKGAAKPEYVDSLREEDLYDLQEYFEKAFEASNGFETVRRLRSTYWPFVETLAPRLGLRERSRLFSLLWGDVAAFTQVYERLFAALQSLGFPADAFCSVGQAEAGKPVGEPGALIPRQVGSDPYSIIDVRALRGLGKPSSDQIALTTRAGATARIARCEVTALTAELRIEIRDQPWPFFDHTDLLDFPGARSREGIKDLDEYLAKGEDQLRGLFVRGKVAYLYERYCAERELTSMLLCIGPSNQEVRTLPGMVNDWIEVTQGATMAERDAQPTALFLVLTKFDLELAKEEQKGEEGSRWSARLNASLIDYLAKQHTWPNQWQRKQPFKNTYFLRNPNFPQRDNFNYEDAGGGHAREVSVRADQAARLARLKEGFVKNEDVRKYFADPDRSWEAAFSVNDGGVSYLAGQLAPVCNPQLKLGQLEGRLSTQTAEMAERLTPYFVDDDVEAERAKKRVIRDELTSWLAGLLEEGRIGDLLHELVIPEEELLGAYRRIDRPSLASDAGAPGDVAAAPKPPPRPVRKLSFGDDDAPAAAPVAAAPPPPPRPQYSKEAQRLAEAFMQAWIERMHEAASDAGLRDYYLVDQLQLLQLVQELASGSRRIKTDDPAAQRGVITLRDAVAAAVQESVRYQGRVDGRGQLPVRRAGAVINGFVRNLGFDRVPAAERPRAGDPLRPIFLPRPAVGDFPRLAEDAPRFEEEYAIDWIGGLRKIIVDNALDRDSGAIDLEQNAALGEILRLLRSA